MSYRRSWKRQEFYRAIAQGAHTPYELPSEVHLHYLLVDGRPRWVSSLRRSSACNTPRCQEVNLLYKQAIPEKSLEDCGVEGCTVCN